MEVVYQTKLGIETDFEFQYLDNVIFGSIPHINHFDNRAYSKSTFLTSPTIVFSHDSSEINIPLKTYLSSINTPYNLLHLSNENLNYSMNIYEGARNILRSYYDPNIKLKNIFSIPLGYKSGFKNDDNYEADFSNKTNPWVFIGTIKSHRTKMLETFKNISNKSNHFTTEWNSTNQLSVDDQKSIYKTTIFSLCPFGNINPDSFRIMETLEWGCIPVVVKFGRTDYYKFIYGDHPFILGKNWEHCKDQIETLLNNKTLLLEKQEQVANWYKTYKSELMRDISRILDSEKEFNIDVLASKQFKYQYTHSISHWMVKLYFSLYFSKNKYLRKLHHLL